MKIGMCCCRDAADVILYSFVPNGLLCLKLEKVDCEQIMHFASTADAWLQCTAFASEVWCNVSWKSIRQEIIAI